MLQKGCNILLFFSFSFFSIMAPKDFAGKEKKIDKYPTLKINRKLRDMPLFQTVESSFQTIATA